MRFNSVIGAIFFVMLSSVLAILIFVQSRSFGSLLSKVITDISERKADTRIEIKNVEISFLPPGIEINKVSFQKRFPDGKNLEAELGQIGFYLGLIEIEERKLALGEIRLSDAVIDFTYPKKNEKPIERIDEKIIEEAFNFSRHLPLRVDTILVLNSKIHANHDLLNIRRLKLYKARDHFVTRFHISNIKPIQDQNLVIDEIWADAEIGKKDITLQRLKIQHDVHTLVVQGKVENWPELKRSKAILSGEGLVYLKAMKAFELPEPIKINSGMAQLNFSLNMENEKFNGDSNLLVKDLRSSFIFADTLSVNLALKNGDLKLSNLNLKYNDEKIAVTDDVIVANIEDQSYLQEPIKAQAENLNLSNALRILGPSFKPLHGKLTGKLRFVYDRKNLHFLPEDGFKINDLALIVGDKKPFQILKVKEAKLKHAEFALINKEFEMSSIIQLKNSLFEVEGNVNKKGAQFAVTDGNIDLMDFGNISNIGVKGKGKLSIDVHGPLNDIVMDFKGKLADFGVLGYELGKSDIDLSIGLGNSTVTINKVESVYGKTNISGNGAINYRNLDIALGINATSASYHDLSIILKPILSKLNFLPPDLDITANIDAYIHGKTSLPLLKLKSHINYTDLTAYGETINQGSFDIKLQDETVSIQNFEGKKGPGDIDGKFSFNLPSQQLDLDFNWQGLKISSFNSIKKVKTNFDGFLAGRIKGGGKPKDLVLNLKTEVHDTHSQSYNFPDSEIEMKITPTRLAGNAQIMGKIIQTEFDYSLTKDRKSSIKLDVDIANIKPIAVAALGQHLEPEEFTGKLAFNFETDFSQGMEHVDLKVTLKQLVFDHETYKVNYQSTTPQFLVKDSRLINWDLNIKETDLFVKSSGEGTFGKNISLNNEIHFNSKIAELLLAKVLSAEGTIKNSIRITGKENEYDLYATSSSERLTVSLEGAPFPLNDMNYLVEYGNKRMVIKEIKTNLDNGTVLLKGDVIFDDNAPDINIKYVLDRAEIPILNKSAINVSGEGILLGNELPYVLSGEILVNKAQIVNELNDFNNKSVAQVRYLPKDQESILGKLLSINVNVKIENPVRVTNSLMDVALKGELRLLGSPARPRGEGRLFAPINTSRIFFKNSEYFITNADINFSPKKDITNPDFDVQAITFITSYKVNAKAYGDLERFSFDLTSDPALPRNSILSLIAFGYTDEIQSQLTQGQQQNLTQMGVGSFVFDRFKISDILNKQFGLQVNLGTVFEQSQTQSMLSGRSQEGQGVLGRTRSATKIELKKRLDEAMTLSVSSTMGGSIGQRQSMNLIYSVNKNVQLEGVYELRTNAEGEEDIINNSAGGDLKFRKTFK